MKKTFETGMVYRGLWSRDLAGILQNKSGVWNSEYNRIQDILCVKVGYFPGNSDTFTVLGLGFRISFVGAFCHAFPRIAHLQLMCASC